MTHILATKDNLDLHLSKLPELTELLTPNCASKIADTFSRDEKFYNLKIRAHLEIPKEDIFFAWLDKIDVKNNQIRVVTMSFPLFGQILEKNSHIKEVLEREIEYEDKPIGRQYLRFRSIDDIDILTHYEYNDIICSNWDFVKVMFKFLVEK